MPRPNSLIDTLTQAYDAAESVNWDTYTEEEHAHLSDIKQLLDYVARLESRQVPQDVQPDRLRVIAEELTDLAGALDKRNAAIRGH
jgi:hypothetical protein